MKTKIDYSEYECPYSHLEKEIGHKLHGPEGYQDVYSVWCTCGFRGPVFYLDTKDLGLKIKEFNPINKNTMEKNNDPYGVHKQVQDFYNLPEWLQELWILDRTLARKAEKEFKHLEQKLKQKEERIKEFLNNKWECLEFEDTFMFTKGQLDELKKAIGNEKY